MEAVGESEDETVHLQGAIDYAERQASFTYEVESKGDRNRESGKFLFVGDTAYVDSALFGFRGEVDKPKPWFSMDMRATQDSLDSFIFPFPFIDPARTLELLFEVSGEIETAGEEDVRGVSTDHYRLTIDLERVVAKAPAQYRAALRAELDAATEKTRSLELWIDDEGLVRRLRVPEPDESVTLDFYDFGVDVEVEAPPADQVAKLPDLLPRGSADYGSTDDDEKEK